jgi:hypothetical protein
MIAAVDSHALLELVWAAPLAALTVTVAWGLVMWGSISATDARRDGRTAQAAFGVGVAVLGATLFTAAVVFGLIVMTSKG